MMEVRLRILTLVMMSAIAVPIGLHPVAASAYDLAGTAGLAGDAYWITVMCGGTKAAQAADSTIDWYPVKNGSDAAEATANYEAVSLAGADAVIVSIFSTEPPAGYVKQLTANGTPVIYINAPPNTPAPYYAGFISAPADNRMNQLADLIIADSGGHGQMAVLGGIAGLSKSLDARWNILTGILARRAPGLQILPTQYDQFDADKANEIVSSLIVANPRLKVVYTVSGPEGEGAVAAVRAAGKARKILVYSFDAIPILQDALRKGDVRALVAQAALLQGEAAVKSAIAYLAAHKSKIPVVPDKLDQPKAFDTMVITKDNIDSPAAQGYLYKATCH